MCVTSRHANLSTHLILCPSIHRKYTHTFHTKIQTHTLPRSRTVCLSTSGSKNVYTISATSSLPDSSLHKDVLLITCLWKEGGEGRGGTLWTYVCSTSCATLLMRSACLRTSSLDWSSEFLSTDCRMTSSRYWSTVHWCTVIICKGRRPTTAGGGDPYQQGEETHISRGRRHTSAGGGDPHQQGELYI